MGGGFVLKRILEMQGLRMLTRFNRTILWFNGFCGHSENVRKYQKTHGMFVCKNIKFRTKKEIK
jgi:hypothetical protein